MINGPSVKKANVLLSMYLAYDRKRPMVWTVEGKWEIKEESWDIDELKTSWIEMPDDMRDRMVAMLKSWDKIHKNIMRGEWRS